MGFLGDLLGFSGWFMSFLRIYGIFASCTRYFSSDINPRDRGHILGVQSFSLFLPVGYLNCGRGIDLAWADETKLLASSSLCNSTPTKNILQATPLIITPGDIKTNHQSLCSNRVR